MIFLRHMAEKGRQDQMQKQPNHVSPAAICLVSGPPLEFSDQVDPELSQFLVSAFNARHKYA